MSSTADRATIRALFKRLARAHADHDADAIVEAYAPNAVIYDLAPPLGHRGMSHDSVTTWLAGWEGPIRIDARDVTLTVDGDLAFVSSLNRMRGRQGGEDQDMWYRTTVCLRKTRALLHGWELSRCGGSQTVDRRVGLRKLRCTRSFMVMPSR
jgi:ketosteroid isomerase-like protein